MTIAARITALMNGPRHPSQRMRCSSSPRSARTSVRFPDGVRICPRRAVVHVASGHLDGRPPYLFVAYGMDLRVAIAFGHSDSALSAVRQFLVLPVRGLSGFQARRGTAGLAAGGIEHRRFPLARLAVRVTDHDPVGDPAPRRRTKRLYSVARFPRSRGA